MVYVIDEYEQRIINKYKDKWIDEGRLEAKSSILRKMLRLGYSEDSIFQIIKFNQDEIIMLRKKLIK